MVPPHGSAPIDESLQVLWVDGERAFCRASRPGSAGGRTTVLAVRPIAQHPPPFTLEQLAHEYALKDELDSAWAVRPLELMREDGRTTLVLEDPGGEPLEALLGTPMELGRFLRLAIRITMALGRLHRGGLVHRDLKPTHILVNCADGQVRVTGFGLASRLPQERQSPEPPERIAGSLAYMAPEQTGRMNRSVDTRSDLYALGVTLYQTLTGTLPFTASDPMEWVQSHIARKPVPPSERITHLPAAVSQIIMKLLAKTAEDRYQSAAGLESDLRRCLAAWNAERRIDDFPLGQHDTPDRLLIPEKLYGREHEVEVLLAAFDRVVKDGAPELVLVAGGSGIGKSAVVGELHKELVPRHGLFASGKFDQHQRDIPYSALVQAFQSVVRPLLGKGDTELAIWRDALLEALGPNARLMTELLPELKRIIGDQPPVPDLEPQQAQRRFQLVFCRFIGVFAGPDRPLALFLDDLQWLDPATLELLEDLLTRSDLQHLMLIGAYRDSEVDAAHPLTRKLDAIRRVGAQVQEIRLAPLPRHGVAQLIADALCCEPERAANLAQLLHEKTAGNPYFVIHFLHALTDEDLLRFDRSAARWTWDLERIRARGFTDDVADLMLGKLRRLPAATQGAMRQFACLGNKVSIATLNVVQGGTEAPLHAALWEAARAGLVLREEGAYLFAHDRVQEGAYALIPQRERPAEHLRIGRRLAAGTPPDTIAESVFEIVGQLNAGAALISAEEERVRLAELNLLAGQRAKASCAYASALTYLEAGRALLPDDCWERCGPLTFALELHRAECEFLTGASAEAAARLAAIAGHAPALPDLAAVTRLRVELFTTIGLSEQAVEVCLDYLRQAGVTWSTHPTQEPARQEHDRIWQLLGDRPIEALLDLPGMADPGACGTMDVLTAFVTPASFIDENLRCLVICRMANLSLEYGNSDASCFAFVLLGAILGQHFGAYQAAYRFGQLGLELEERRGPSRFAARVRMWFACLVSPWARHVRTSRPILRQALDAASRIGDLGYAVYSRSSLLTNLLASGDPLADVQREAEAGLAIARQLRLGLAIDFITAHLRLARTLRGQTPDLAFNDAEFDEERFEERLGADPRLSLATCWYWIRKLQARFFAGAYASAIAAASKAERLLRTSLPLFEAAEYHLYAALARAALCDAAPTAERTQHLEAVAAHLRQLQLWAENCPENFADRAALVSAEIARIEGRDADAMQFYEQAIRAARASGFVHNEALANELAGRFCAARGLETNAHAHLRNARQCYLRWGADGKVRQLEALHPHLREEERVPGSTGLPVEHLDLATVMKVSQAVSGEMVLEKLFDTLLRTALEQAGADSGLLVLLTGAEPRIVAEVETRGDTVTVHLRDLPVLPDSMFRHVLRTGQSVILDDAAAQSSFAADPHVHRRQARSMLWLPLINRAKLIGVLYLENNLTPRAFAPARITVLKLLACQAAISIENTRLYRDLEEREAKIRRLVDANIIGIFIREVEGRILEANDAFLGMVGYDRADLVAGRLRWTELTPPEWRDRDARATQELRSTGTAQPYEQEYFHKDGSRVPVLIGVAGLERGGNQGVAFVLDLTERKRVEEALRESEEQWKAVFENNPTMFFMIDAAGTIISVNPLGAEQLGYAAEDLIGRAVENLFHEADRAAVQRNTAICLEQIGRAMSWELRKVRSDGQVLWVRETARAMVMKKRPVVLIVCEDITERMRAAETLREVQMELAHANRVATTGQLTASIAHEVNQPIAATVMNAQAALRWLQSQPPDLEEVRLGLARIVRDGDRAGEIIARIRALIRKAPPRKGGIAINDAILEIVALTHGEAIKNGVSVRTQLAPGLPPIEGDRVQLQQVILNLIVNAIEAMSGTSGAPRELVLNTAKAEPDSVQVAVRDSGPGLAPVALERLFGAFYTTKPSGLGLGLSICRSIVEAHGGRLWATANQPRGAIF